MSARHTHTLELHKAAVDTGLRDVFPQYHNLLRALQYSIPHEKTLAHTQPGMRVLDWGCGNGHFSWFLLRHAMHVTGYSFRDAPEILRNNPDFQHVRGSAKSPVELPFETASFDAVFSIGVLEHVHECGGSQLGSLREIARVLKPGGLFHCFHLPNTLSWVEQLCRVLKPVFGKKLHAHTRLFNERDIRALCAETGFALLDLGRYNVLPRNQLAKLLPSLTMRPGFVSTLDTLDETINGILPYFSQQWYFSARNGAN
ncbi:methyltransferase domain protein [Desulfovibrio sp. A2]|nr:methyltransferase domain protein [Desulfovibrio sp. A2]